MRTFKFFISSIFWTLVICGAWVTWWQGGSIEWIFASLMVLGGWAFLYGAGIMSEITGNYPTAAAASFNAAVASASAYVTFVGGYWPIPIAPWWIWGASVVSLTPLGLVFWKRKNPRAKITGEKWERGMRLVSEKVLRRTLKRAGGDGLVIGDGMRLSAQKEREGVLAVGATGSGKTAGVINRIVADVTTRENCKTVIYDVKGDFTEGGNNFYLFAPWDTRTFGFALDKEIQDQGDCDLFALACVPPLAQATNPFWQNAPRMICAAILWGLLCEGRLSWASLLAALMDRNELLRIIKLTDKGRMCLDYFADDESAGNVMACLQQELNFVSNMVAAGMDAPKDFGFREWFKADPSDKMNTLILQRNAKFDRMSAKLITVIVQLLILESQRLENDSQQRRFFILDELGTLPQIANLVSDGINLLRQKGVCFVIGIQDIAGLRRVYGPEQAQEISNSLATKVIYRMSEAATVKWAEETLGKAEYLVDTRSVSDQQDHSKKSESKNQRREVRPVVMASEISAIPESRGEKIISIFGKKFAWDGSVRPIVGYLMVGGLDGLVARCEWKYFGLEKIRPATVWADWVSQIPGVHQSIQTDPGKPSSFGGQGEQMEKAKKVTRKF